MFGLQVSKDSSCVESEFFEFEATRLRLDHPHDTAQDQSDVQGDRDAHNRAAQDVRESVVVVAHAAYARDKCGNQSGQLHQGLEVSQFEHAKAGLQINDQKEH
jgi:hypothetical protein